VLARVHAADYIASMEKLSAAGGGRLDADTPIGPHTARAAGLAAGAVVLAVERVLDGRWSRAFCSVRPPGHHASRERGTGFCVFNNVAVGAAAALDRVGRVAILDWDAHHGNGTQAIFARDPRVFYASWHQSPFYPDTGRADEVGEASGVRTVVNCPLPAGAGDAELMAAWAERIEPALRTFRPELLLVSAGFDADVRDPLTDLAVTSAGFAALSRAVVDWADEHCSGRIVSVLEGGYALDALVEDVVAHVRALLPADSAIAPFTSD
jgi:acetoin utilization deacetylase AcuC-like enzyme